MKRLLMAAAMLGLPGLAQAQGAPADLLMQVENESAVVVPFGLTVEQMDNMDVIGPDGRKVGEVEEVLMMPDGMIEAVTVEVAKPLGIGNRDVIVWLPELQRHGSVLVTGMTEAYLETRPTWTD